MFASASLARRIERADAALIAAVTGHASRRVPPGQPLLVELNGGVVSYLEPGSPYNKAAGFGFDGVPPADRFDLLEREFDARNAALQFEVSSLADPALARALTSRGYLVAGFENILGLDPAAADVAPPEGDVRVTPAPPDPAVWIETMTDGFASPDVYDGPPPSDEIPREALERIFGDTSGAGLELLLAWRDGVVAGAATMRVQERVAQFCGAATLPAHRRRGVQAALLRYRIAEARRRGCDIAVVTTSPGSTSQANAQKAGFAMLYTRVLLIRPPRATL